MHTVTTTTTTNLDMEERSIWNGDYSFMDYSILQPADQTVVAVSFRNIFSLAACWLVVRESVSPHLPWCVKIVTNVSWVWFVRLFGQILSWHVTWQRIMTDITAAIYILWGAERGTSIRWRYTLHQQHTAELQPRTPTRHHTLPASSKFHQVVYYLSKMDFINFNFIWRRTNIPECQVEGLVVSVDWRWD